MPIPLRKKPRGGKPGLPISELGGPLTTGMAITPTPAAIPHNRGSVAAESSPRQVGAWSNTKAGSSLGPQEVPDTFTVSDSLELVAGVYIQAAPTGAGKTVLSMAEASWFNYVGLPTTYVSCFEPRSPIGAGQAGYRIFEAPEKFWSDASKVVAEAPASQFKCLIFDSVTLPLKAYAGIGKAYSNQSTFPGGMQPSDIGFMVAATQFARKNNACLILNVNSTLVPYVASLAGSTEGIIQVVDVGSFSIADRSAGSKRSFQTQEIPEPFVAAALSYFGFGSYNRTGGRNVKRGYTIE